MLSICIPTYNYDVSVLVQTLVTQAERLSYPLEICIRDDASHSHLISEISLPQTNIPIKTASNSENLGRTATRHLLAEDAQYEHLLFLDSDTLPANADFLNRLGNYLNSTCDVIAGGITYTSTPPDPELRLRWLFGTKREARPPSEREKHPYLIVSGNLGIKKNLFLACNPKDEKGYGLDNILALALEKRKASICHIDNAVYHLGLETNAVFLEKAFLAIDQLVTHQKRHPDLPQNTRLQQYYQKLKKYGLIPLVYKVLDLLYPRLKKRTLSPQPSLGAFDMLRLHYYIKQQRHD